MTWLALWAALQVGLMPNNEIALYGPGMIDSRFPQTAYVSLETELQAFDNHVFVGGSVKTEVQKGDAARASGLLPESSTYSFRFGLRWGGLEAGWFRVCAHPVLPFYYDYRPVIVFDRRYDEVYIRFSGKIDLAGGKGR